MRSFENKYLDGIPISHDLIRSLHAIGEHRGREALFNEQAPQVLKTLREVAIIQSTESSNRIEGVTAVPERLRALVAEKTKPQDRSEQEIAGYRDVLSAIHPSHPHMEPSPNVVLQLHRDLFRYTSGGGGQWKLNDNTIEEFHADGSRHVRFQPVPAFRTAEAVGRLYESFQQMWTEDRIDKLVVTAAYVLDFLCIHPFADGNGRMARLLTLLLLYRAGYTVGRYISLERLIEQSKETYYEALYDSSQKWHNGEHDLRPWLNYFLGIILAAYREFEDRVGEFTTGRGTKSDTVRSAIRHMHGEFSARDIQNACPNVSIDLIRRVLREERVADRVQCLGRGPNARWRAKR